MNLSIKDYYTQRRFETAAKMLAQDFTIARISQVLHFSDDSSFCKAFKNIIIQHQPNTGSFCQAAQTGSPFSFFSNMFFIPRSRYPAGGRLSDRLPDCPRILTVSEYVTGVFSFLLSVIYRISFCKNSTAVRISFSGVSPTSLSTVKKP